MSEKHCKNCHHGNSFMHGVMLGVVAGAVLGVLIAPDSGKNTKAKLKAASQKTRSQAQPIIEDLRPLVEKLVAVSEPTRQEITQKISQLIESSEKS